MFAASGTPAHTHTYVFRLLGISILLFSKSYIKPPTNSYFAVSIILSHAGAIYLLVEGIIMYVCVSVCLKVFILLFCISVEYNIMYGEEMGKWILKI